MTDLALEHQLSDIRSRIARCLTADADISVFYRPTPTSALTAIKPGPSYEEFCTSAARQALLEEMSWTARPVLVLDPANDSRLKGLLPDGIGVMMGAPIVTPVGVVGYLCADSERRHGSFCQVNLKKMEEMAAEACRLWPEHSVKPGSDVTRNLPWFATVAIVVLLTVATVSLKPTSPKTQHGPPRAAQPSNRQSATAVAGSFLSSLQTRQFSSAYFLLDGKWKERLSPSEFEQKVSKWLEVDDHFQRLSFRHVKNESLAGIKPVVTIFSDNPKEDERDWAWQMVTEDNAYKLAVFDGGPDLGDNESEWEKTSNP